MCKDYTTDPWGNITSRYQIGISVYPPSVLTPNKPDSCYIDSWICTANGRRTTYTSPVYRDIITDNGDTITQRYDNFYTNGSNRCSVGTYTIHDSIISVGGFIGRNKFFSMPDNQIVDFDVTIGSSWWNSSYQYPGYGPTKKALPTITAPSYVVVSSANHLAGINEWTPYTVMKWGKDYWGAMSGTSLAAPAVAGIIAQWLQINPNLSPSQVKEIIAQTAIKDNFTQNSVRFGPNGKIDAMAGAKYLLGIEDPVLIIGDVSGDGEVDILDVTWFIDFLLGVTHEGFVIEAADIKPDEEINVRDLTGLIDILLNNEQ
jgi:subtilisin family serine protease